MEELDMLSRESSEHVKRICSVHIRDPKAAPRKAWGWLQDCYASPEIIEIALFKKLDNFPRISATDYTKFRELGDLLMQLQYAKAEGYLLGSMYMDTAHSISPKVEKLHYGHQEKWISHGSWYKGENGGCFPPKSFVLLFRQRQGGSKSL